MESNNMTKYKLRTQEHRKNLSLALRGNKNRLGNKQSEETKKKISMSEKGKHVSEETKERQRKSKLIKPTMYWVGKHRSEETKLKISNNLRGRFKGEKSSTWKGGLSFEPYGLDFDENLKEVIRNRDRRKCQICDKTELENRNKLDCHHIDYNKKSNDPKNLVSLCHNCHTKTNHNREYWISYFNNLYE